MGFLGPVIFLGVPEEFQFLEFLKEFHVPNSALGGILLCSLVIAVQ